MNKSCVMSRNIALVAILLALLLVASYGLSFGARYYWLFDILRQFVHQYFLGSIILAVLFVCERFWIWATLMLAVTSMTLYEISSKLDSPPPTQSPKKVLKVAHYNQFFGRGEYKRVPLWIHEEKPDFFVLQEANSTLSKKIKELEEYSFQVHKIMDNPFGLILASKHPITKYSIKPTKTHGFRNLFIHAIIKIDKKNTLSVYSVHTTPPVSSDYFKQRNEDLRTVIQAIQSDTQKNIIMMGDWNITPYSPFFSDILDNTGLKNQYTKLIPLPTWPSGFYDYIFQIPIDHILHKGDIQLIEKRRTPHMGSDHYPVIAVFAMPSQTQRVPTK